MTQQSRDGRARNLSSDEHSDVHYEPKFATHDRDTVAHHSFAYKACLCGQDAAEAGWTLDFEGDCQ